MDIPIYSNLGKKQKLLMKVIAVIAIVVLAVLYFVSLSINSALHATSSQPISATGPGSLSSRIDEQLLLTAANSTQLVPYVLVGYNESNGTQLYVTGTIYSAKPPSTIYLLNWTGECTQCSKNSALLSNLTFALERDGLVTPSNPIQVIPITSVQSISNDSILIIMDGLLPSQLLNQISSNYTVLQSLLQRGTSIIYVGQNFSRLVSSQSTIVPNKNIPSYLATTSVGQTAGSQFNFSDTTFAFTNGRQQGSVTYEPVTNGYIIAFSNYPDIAWSFPQKGGSDIALAIQSLFWLNKLATGTYVVNLTTEKESGKVGVPMSTILLPNILPSTQGLQRGYGEAALYLLNSLNVANSTKQINSEVKAVQVIPFIPAYQLNGTIGVPSSIIPGRTYNATISMYSAGGQVATPHIDIYNRNMTLIYSMAPFFTRTVTNNFSFIEPLSFNLGVGKYIVLLDGFNNQRYGATYTQVPKVNLSVLNINPEKGTVVFAAHVAGQPLSNLNVNITLNGQYPSNVPITNGTFTFQTPGHGALPSGNLTFRINMLSSTYYYYTSYNPVAFTINSQYIEFVIAMVIVLMEVTLVRAPNRDEFYVDVPNMPEPPKVRIKVKSGTVLDVFKSLNDYYKWKYMPLSRGEFRYAMSLYVKQGNLQVVPTYNNVDTMLNQLVHSGSLVAADGLFAPKAWVDMSKHDIEYLAIFKKLRVYLVSHGLDLSDLDKSDVADMVTRLHGEKAYIAIYSNTSRFSRRIPIFKDGKTYLAFLNSDKLDEFKGNLSNSTSRESEQLKLYISSGSVVLLDADNSDGGPAAS